MEVGTQLPSLTVRFTRERLVRYAGASTDFNPIHYSEYFAAQAGLPGVIAQACSRWEQRFGWSPTGSEIQAGSPPTSSGSPGRWSCPMMRTASRWSSVRSVSGIEGSLVTVSIEAISAGQKVLGAARAEVDLGVRVPHRDHES